MHVELPQFTRCCFCFPLRRGLLFWGYLKLIVAVVYFSLILMVSYQKLMYHVAGMIVLIIALLLIMMDIGFSIVLIVGAHKKKYKLLRVYYFFALTLLIIYSSLFALYASLEIWTISTKIEGVPASLVASELMKEASVFFVNVVVQVYLLLLIRSEVIKLKSGCRFQFTNNAADAQCEFTQENGKTVV